MGRFLYNLLLPIYLVVSLPGLVLKMRRRGGYGSHFWQRFGIFDRATRARLAAMPDPWWIHAVSVGEVLVAVKLIERIRKRCPEQRVVLSTTSSTGHATAREKAPEDVFVFYNPVDLLGVVGRILRIIRPAVIVLMESELWPNLIATASKRSIPVVIANARLSPRSGKRYARFRRLTTPTLDRLTAVFTQEEEDAVRWAKAGLSPKKAHCVGSIKFDPMASQQPPEAQVDSLEAILTELWGAKENRYTLLLGSSHDGEELAITQCYARLRQDFPRLRLVLVPRHFERAQTILSEIEKLALPVEQRSLWPARREANDSRPAILLVDSTGELRAWFQTADAVIMGKSFLGHGGQNPAEPIMAGCPVLVGPHMENFEALMTLLRTHEGIAQMTGLDHLETTLRAWLAAPSVAVPMAQRGLAALEQHAGATDRTVEKLLEIVGKH